MKLQPAQFAAGMLGVLLVLGAGLLFMERRSGVENSFNNASYDWAFDFTCFSCPSSENAGAVILYLDTSPAVENVSGNLRSRLATLINRLTDEQCPAVVLDMDLSQPGENLEDDDWLAHSIQRNGKVVISATTRQSQVGKDPKPEMVMPYSLFSSVVQVGYTHHLKDSDFTVRRHSPDRQEGLPSLTHATARVLGLPGMEDLPESRWLRYYGGPGAIPSVVVRNELPASEKVRGKVVFVSLWPSSLDQFRCPSSFLGVHRGDISGVEIHATELLNLMRRDWLTRLPAWGELLILLAGAIAGGFVVVRLRAVAAMIFICLLGVLFTMVALWCFLNLNVWLPWMVFVSVQLPTGLVWGLTCYSTDQYIQRRQLDRERREADRRLREQAALLDKAQDAIIVHDLEWRVSFWNQSAERLYGWTSREIHQRCFMERVSDGDQADYFAAKEAALRSGEWMGELKQRTKTGAPVLVQSRWSLVKDDQGQPRSFLVINTDITERKRLESHLLRAQRMESIGTLAGGIAHDLNNVLVPIVMGVELLQSRTQDENSHKLLRTMFSSARRGADMVKQVLTFARGHDGDRVPLQLTHLLGEMQKILRETFPKSITLEIQSPAELPLVCADATQLHQVLLNLCVNARDAMPHGGSLRVEASEVTLAEADCARLMFAKPGLAVRLRVRDTGTGIPRELQDKIFEPFFTTKQLGSGTGLGLATVLSIVRSHGGVIDLTSEPGCGSTFDIYLPAMRGNAVVPAVRHTSESVVGGSETILVADDEKAILEVTVAVLGEHGYRVITANNGAEAVERVLQGKEPVDLVIMDMMMPVMDGTEAMRTLRASRPHLHFIAMSGLQPGERAREVADAAFLPKPFTAEKLLLTVRQVLSNRGEETLFYRRALPRTEPEPPRLTAMNA